jgi:hypothetical protein
VLYVHADISIFLLRRTKGTGQGVPLCDVCVDQPGVLVEGVVDERYAAAVDVQISLTSMRRLTLLRECDVFDWWRFDDVRLRLQTCLMIAHVVTAPC